MTDQKVRMTLKQRERFDELLEEAISELPEGVRELLDEVPVIAEDRPTSQLLQELAEDPAMKDELEDVEDPSSLCGLHTGFMATEKSVEQSAEVPNQIFLFRDGIVALAGGWSEDGSSSEEIEDAEDAIYDEIVVTLLHELGHQYGLEEEDLKRLGYE